jgi:hypothetical protein
MHGWKQETAHCFAGHLGHIFLLLSSGNTWLQKLHHLSEHVACATDNCKNAVNHFVPIKLTCIIIVEKHVYPPRPTSKMCTWRTPVYHVTKLSLAKSMVDYSITVLLSEKSFFDITWFIVVILRSNVN